MADVRYSAFGGPALIAVCEHVARGLEGARRDQAPTPDAAGWLSALSLPRTALGDALVAEDAYRALLTRLDTGAG